MRIIYMGSPKEAVAPLSYLKDFCEQTKKHELVAVVSKPARKKGRGKTLQDPAVAEFAKSLNITTLQPNSAKDESFLDEVRSLQPDIIVTCAYGEILTDDFLNIPIRAVINIHPSLLPFYRGAIPVPAAILNGDTVTGVSILFTVKKLDAGAIILQEPIEIEDAETADKLLAKAMELGGTLLPEALELLEDSDFLGEPQDEEEVTHCTKISKEDGCLDFNEPAENIYLKFKAFYPWPGVFTFGKKGKVIFSDMSVISMKESELVEPLSVGEYVYSKSLKALLVGTGEGLLKVVRLKPENSKEQEASAYWNGLKTKTSEFFYASQQN